MHLFHISDHENKTGETIGTLKSKSLDEVKSSLDWQIQGGFDENDYAICERISANEFQSIYDKNIYTMIKLSFTQKAFDKFIKDYQK